METVTFWALLVLSVFGLLVGLVNGGAALQLAREDSAIASRKGRLLGHLLLAVGAVLALIGLFAGRWFALVGGVVASVGWLVRSEPSSRVTATVLGALLAAAAIGFFVVRG